MITRFSGVVVFAVIMALSATSAQAGPFDYVCHDRGDGSYDRVQVDTLPEAQAHEGHAGDIIPELFYGEAQVGPQNYEGAGEDIWSVGCVVPVENTPPAPPTETPEFTEATEVPPTPIVVTDPPGYSESPTPKPTYAPGVPEVETVTALPDTGSGQGKEYEIWEGILMAMGLAAALVALALGLASVTSRRTRS